jgi:hypothetical protein
MQLIAFFTTPRRGTSLVRGVARRGICLIIPLIAGLLLVPGLTSCATKKSAVVPPSKLPKPAPMRFAQADTSRRKPPLLPKTVSNIPQDDSPTAMTDDLISSKDSSTVDSNVPKFINNEQPQDFFQGAGDGPAGETVLGSFFDSVFRPANPPNQPVSSTSYTVE